MLGNKWKENQRKQRNFSKRFTRLVLTKTLQNGITALVVMRAIQTKNVLVRKKKMATENKNTRQNVNGTKIGIRATVVYLITRRAKNEKVPVR